MNKYQKAVLENEKGKSFFSCSSKKSGALLNAGFDYDADCYKLLQEEDIFSTQYEFAINATPNIESCAFLSGGKWQDAHIRGSNFLVVLDFEHRIEKIKLVFADNIVDDYVFSVQYIEADRELYYQKQEATLKKNRLDSAQIKHATGADLINIYFQPCCSEYDSTEILLFIPKDFERVGGPRGPIDKPVSWTLIKKCNIPKEDFYKAITDLAPGTYSFIIKQYGKNGDLLMETEHIEFQIKASKHPPRRFNNVI